MHEFFVVNSDRGTRFDIRLVCCIGVVGQAAAKDSCQNGAVFLHSPAVSASMPVIKTLPQSAR